MTGGELQIAIYGGEDLYLTGNPQMSFFKKVYRRYTNFSMESKTLDFEGNTKLPVNTPLELKCKIQRYGDLVSNMYFTFTLPDIYSMYADWSWLGMNYPTYYPTDYPENLMAKMNFEFRWIDNIGNNIIDNVRISIGGQMIDKHYGEWLTIWHQIHNSKEELHPRALKTDAFFHNYGRKPYTHNIYNRMIGNTKELTDPKYGNNAFGSRYPNTYYHKWNNGEYEGYPSIEKKKIYVPLVFWFNQDPGLALPLIALQHQDVYIHIELRPLLDLYTVQSNIEKSKNIAEGKLDYYYETKELDKINGKAMFGMEGHRTSALANIRHIYPFYTSKPRNGNNNENISRSLIDWHSNNQYQVLDIDPHLEVNYIFLSKTERMKYMNLNYEYLIEIPKRFTSLSNHSKISKMIIELNNPVKYFVWMAKRDDMYLINKYNNYTNWVDPNYSPYRTDRLAFGSPQWYYDSENEEGMYPVRGVVKNPPTASGGDYYASDPFAGEWEASGYAYSKELYDIDESFLQKEIITNTRIKFNGINRIDKDSNYFQNIQHYQNNGKTLELEGIYMYSFELGNQHNNQYQPSGSCNMGRIQKIEMEFDINTPPPKTSTDINSDVSSNYYYRYDIYVYALTYNVLKISGGVAQLEYAS